MDTLTHALSGALVGRVLAGRRAPGAAAAAGGASGTGFGAGFGASSAARPAVPVWQMVAAGTVAATFPDLDFVLGWISELTYLRGHRGVTHSLILLPLWGLLIAWLLARFWQRGGRVAAGWRRKMHRTGCRSHRLPARAAPRARDRRGRPRGHESRCPSNPEVCC